MTAWTKYFLLSTILLAGCKKPIDPVQPIIPVCRTEPGGPVSSTTVWNLLPAISTEQPIFKEAEKLYRKVFSSGNYTDVVTKKQYLYTVVADGAENLQFPTDVAQNPIRPNELWVTNYGESFKRDYFSKKGNTLTVFNPAQPSQFSVIRKDKSIFTGHFFSFPTSIAFNRDGYWASTSHKNNNGNNGPTFWTSDFAIYADSAKYTLNGSHSSMLHESPISLGIAADENGTFWVLDGTTGDVVSYNFGKGHYPGGDDHSDAVIRRYSLPGRISPIMGIPSHVCYDLTSKWLYVVDARQQRIVRLKTNSGQKVSGKTGDDKAKEYSIMSSLSEVFLENMPLELACGIDIDGANLYVSDYETGRIGIFSLSTKILIGTIDTKNPGIAGLMVLNGSLWFVNSLQNQLIKIEL